MPVHSLLLASGDRQSSGINLESCYTTCRTGIMLHWATGFEMKALILLTNSIFYVHLVFIKDIKTNIPWEYKIPTKLISVNRGKKMRPQTTVISWSLTSQASYISTFLYFRNAARANGCCLCLWHPQNQHCGDWDGWTQDILAVNFCRCPTYKNFSTPTVLCLSPSSSKPQKTHQVRQKNVTLSMLNALFGKHTNTNRVGSFKTTALEQK